MKKSISIRPPNFTNAKASPHNVYMLGKGISVQVSRIKSPHKKNHQNERQWDTNPKKICQTATKENNTFSDFFAGEGSPMKSIYDSRTASPKNVPVLSIASDTKGLTPRNLNTTSRTPLANRTINTSNAHIPKRQKVLEKSKTHQTFEEEEKSEPFSQGGQLTLRTNQERGTSAKKINMQHNLQSRGKSRGLSPARGGGAPSERQFETGGKRTPTRVYPQNHIERCSPSPYSHHRNQTSFGLSILNEGGQFYKTSDCLRKVACPCQGCNNDKSFLGDGTFGGEDLTINFGYSARQYQGTLSQYPQNLNLSPFPYSKMLERKAELQEEWDSLATHMETLEIGLEMMKDQHKAKFDHIQCSLEDCFTLEIKLAEKFIFLVKRLLSGDLEEELKSELQELFDDLNSAFDEITESFKEEDINCEIVSEMKVFLLWVIESITSRDKVLNEVMDKRAEAINQVVSGYYWHNVLDEKRKELELCFKDVEESKMEVMKNFEEVDLFFELDSPSEDALTNLYGIKYTSRQQILKVVTNTLHLRAYGAIKEFEDVIIANQKELDSSCKDLELQFFHLIEKIVNSFKSSGETTQLSKLSEKSNLKELIRHEIVKLAGFKLRQLLNISGCLKSYQEDAATKECEIENEKNREIAAKVSKFLNEEKLEILGLLFTEMEEIHLHYNDLTIVNDILTLLQTAVKLCIQMAVDAEVHRAISEKLEIVNNYESAEEGEQLIDLIVQKAIDKLENSDIKESFISQLSQSSNEIRLMGELTELWWIFRLYIDVLRLEDQVLLRSLGEFYNSISSHFSMHEGQVWGYNSENESISIEHFLRQVESQSQRVSEINVELLLNDAMLLEEEALKIEEKEKELKMLAIESSTIKEAIKEIENEKTELYNRSANRGAYTERQSILNTTEKLRAGKAQQSRNGEVGSFQLNLNKQNQDEIEKVQYAPTKVVNNHLVDNIEISGTHEREVEQKEEEQEEEQNHPESLQSSECDLSDIEIRAMFSRFNTRSIKDRFVRKLMTQLKLKGELGNNGFYWMKEALDGIQVRVRSLPSKILNSSCSDSIDYDEPETLLELFQAIDAENDPTILDDLGYAPSKLVFDGENLQFRLFQKEDLSNSQSESNSTIYNFESEFIPSLEMMDNVRNIALIHLGY